MNQQCVCHPSEPSLEAAIHVCIRHGIYFKGLFGQDVASKGVVSKGRSKRPRKQWRVEFLTALKARKKIAETIRGQGLSTKTVYAEKKSTPSFRRAMEMAVGKVAWEQASWDDAIADARAKEASAKR